jgi:hypothetical protein
MGQGLGGIPSGGSGSSLGEIESMLSGLGGLNRDHELVRHVQQNSGLKDPGTARQYTQQGVEILDERSRSNPQGLQSLLGGFLGGGGSSRKQQGKGGGGGLGEMLGDVLGKQALYLFCAYFLLFWKENDH